METRLYYLAAILVVGMLAQWMAWRWRVPAILLLLLFGFVAGHVYDPVQLIGEDLLFSFVSLAVAVILFEGGLGLKFSEIVEVRQAVIRLVTIGVVVTWILAAAAAWYLLGMSPPMAILLGAILTVSGPTVVLPLLLHVRPVARVSAIAKWEGIVNDPVAATLAVVTFQVIITGAYGEAATVSAYRLLLMAGAGTILGLLATVVVVQLLKNFLVPDYLQNAFLLSCVTGTFALSNSIAHESGLIAVTVFGIALANQKVVAVKHLVEFKENLRILLISTLFLLLASLCSMEQVRLLGWREAAFLAFLLLIVRPLAVLCSTWGTPTNWREFAFLAWLAPRGIVAAAVSSLFALELMELSHTADQFSPAMEADISRLVPITFAVMAGTVIVYSFSSGWVARRLGLSDPEPQGIVFVGADNVVREIAAAVRGEGFSVLLIDTNYRHIMAARMMGLRGYCASILSEYALEETDLSGIGTMLAMTPSHEVNVLATIEFGRLFGRRHVFQLPAITSKTKRQEPVPSHLTARPLFAAHANHAWLADRFTDGALVKKTRLTEEFTWKDFLAHYGGNALPLFSIDTTKKLLIVSTAAQPVEMKPSLTVICLVNPVEETEEPKRGGQQMATAKPSETPA